MKKTVFGRLAVYLMVLSLLYPPGIAQAGNLVVNGGFETRSNPLSNLNKDYFINVDPDPWNITQAPGTSLAHIVAPGFATANPLPVYGPFPTSSAGGTSTAGGYFLESDGDPRYSGVITQTLSGLASGQAYRVLFKQAAGQQQGYSGSTTERWRVKLGDAPAKLSDMFSLPQGGVGQWQNQMRHFTPSAGSSLVLEFFAVGTPQNQPPICFLDSVGVYAIPEPGSLLLIGIGLIVSVGFGRFRAKSAKV